MFAQRRAHAAYMCNTSPLLRGGYAQSQTSSSYGKLKLKIKLELSKSNHQNINFAL
jgi:hypothetical protein